jgi:pimeloyl-ACP methyl ester carboxylesterase
MTTSAINQLQVNVQGSDILVWHSGDHGPAIILIHGAGGNRREWEQTILALSDGCRVYAPDLIGFGDSPRDNITYTIEIFRDFVIGLMDELGIENAVLVGHSLGGRINLAVASAIPERINRLVLIAPLGFGNLSLTGRVIATSAWAIHKAARISLPYPTMELKLNDYKSNVFENVRAPTLLIWGSRDLYFPKSHGWIALKTLPDATLKIYNGAGHAPHKDYPRHFASDVKNFIAQD